MLEIVALNDLASVLCAREFSFSPQGGCTQNYPLFIHYYYFILILIIIIKALRLAAVVLMCFFGPSALAVEAYGFTLVRPFVRSFVRS